MVEKAKQVFGEEEKITVVADTGYFNMSEIINTVDDNTEILIKKRKGAKKKPRVVLIKKIFNMIKKMISTYVLWDIY